MPSPVRMGHAGTLEPRWFWKIRRCAGDLLQPREKSGLTQAAFAACIETPVARLRDWEQGRFAPPGGVVCLLRLIVEHHELAGELSAI